MNWLLWLVLASPVTVPVADVDAALSRIERKANLVQQHPDSATAEAQAAARTADRLAPQIENVAPGLVEAVDQMSTYARMGTRSSSTRDKAIEVMERVRAARDVGE